MLFLVGVLAWMSPSQFLCVCVGVCVFVHVCVCVSLIKTDSICSLFVLSFFTLQKIFGIEYFPSVLETLQSCGFPPQKAENES